MTLNQLIYFQAIAKLQHYRQAAINLNISQPSLSRSMTALEEELGILLFEKHGRNVVLTKYGHMFLEHVEKILAEVNLAEHKMKQLAGNGGHIDLAYVFPLANYYIPHMVRQFLNQKQNKDITFSFNQLITSNMIEGLKNDKYDVIFGSYKENEPSIQFVPIMSQSMVIITPKEHPLSANHSIALSELEHYPIIGYDPHSGLGRFTNRIYKAHALKPNIVCESPDEHAIASLVAENFGIAMVADVDSIHQANVSIHPLDGPALEHTVYMAYLKDKYQIPAVKKFIKFIKKAGTA